MNYLNNPNVPRGIRNNNPGNLVRTGLDWLGKIPFSKSKDTHFEQFTEMKYGIRAMMRDILNDIKKGNNTIAKLIAIYAPSFENNTTAYINTVSNAINIAPNVVLDLSEETLVLLCKAIVLVENGATFSKYITNKDYQDAIAILGIPLKKKAI